MIFNRMLSKVIYMDVCTGGQGQTDRGRARFKYMLQLEK